MDGWMACRQTDKQTMDGWMDGMSSAAYHHYSGRPAAVCRGLASTAYHHRFRSRFDSSHFSWVSERIAPHVLHLPNIVSLVQFIRTMDLHHASGAFITLQEAFAQAAEEITQYHLSHGFPVRLTTHTGADVPRRMSNQNHDYVDMGNWTGSVLMYSLLFDHDLIRIFDTTGVREAVYRNWGSDRQRSGKGQDNARTNLLEAILTVMGHDNARRTQLAWKLVWRYALRHPHMKRQQLLEMSKDDKSKDLYGDDDALADKILAEFDRDYDGYVSVNLAKLFPTVRQTRETPDYYTICDLTGCSSKNSTLKNLYWSAAERFRTLYSADSTVQIVQ